MKLHDAIQDYLLHIRHERGLAQSTIKCYQSRLHHLERWLADNGRPDPDLDAFSTPVLRHYLHQIAAQGRRPRTIHSAFDPIRGLGVFLVANGSLKKNPAVVIPMPKKDAAIRLTTSDEEIALLFAACERQRAPRKIALSRAILSVLVYGGLRRQELLDLHVDDVDLAEKSLLVRSGKGSKSRRVFLCDEGVQALREWLNYRSSDCHHDWLWAYDRNRRLYQEGLRVLIEEIKAIAGLRDHANIKPHSLRHACATRLLRHGADLRSIQAFLGHAHIGTTALYLHTDEQQLRSIAHLSSLKVPTADTAAKEPEQTPAPASTQPLVPAEGAKSGKQRNQQAGRLRRERGSERGHTVSRDGRYQVERLGRAARRRRRAVTERTKPFDRARRRL